MFVYLDVRKKGGGVASRPQTLGEKVGAFTTP